MSSEETESRVEAGAGERALAAVVLDSDDGSSVYNMYEIQDMLPTGAFLAGSLHLEVGENVILELLLGEGEKARVAASVLSVERDDNPGIFVSFSELGESETNLIKTWAARPAHSARE